MSDNGDNENDRLSAGQYIDPMLERCVTSEVDITGI